jgi:catechol 2,3-dioxygenase-like lactoylglutathione lyase family enzyme
VAFRVADVPKSREFYRTLGWEQAFEFSDDKGTATSYVKVNDRQFIELYRRGAPTDALGLMHICLEGADLGTRRGLPQSRTHDPTEPRKARAGNLLFNIHDAGGPPDRIHAVFARLSARERNRKACAGNAPVGSHDSREPVRDRPCRSSRRSSPASWGSRILGTAAWARPALPASRSNWNRRQPTGNRGWSSRWPT